MKKKFELEYTINSSPKVLYNRLSTPGGLSEWFADDVNLQGKVFTFIWEGTEQEAEVILKKENIFIRFHWVSDVDIKTFFEFRITQDELTGDVSLLITDFAEEDEKNDSIDLWDTQIGELKHVIGL
ncbi:MAG: SRPBCC domain-containing protein [Bacteroidales bacterium]|nr:SRPBCC domain-containing protein [Bacteroidales bacterium]